MPQAETALAPAPRQEIATTRTLDLQALIEKALDDNANVEIVEKLLAMAKDIRATQAREAWFKAMAAFQRDCPPIRKSKTADVATRQGGRYVYRYAPLDEILETTRPVMGPLGLSVSWTTRFENKMVIANCRVSHEAGHVEESGEIPIPVDESGIGASVAQRIGIATTYAKRYTLLSIIGIAPEDDDDAAHSDPPAPRVQQPRRRSEQTVEASATSTGGAITVTSVTSSSGNAAGKPWTLYTITLSDGRAPKTFDEGIADVASSFKSSGEAVTVEIEETPKGPKLTGISAETAEMELPHVTEVLREAGLVDATWFTDEARERGTAVHAAIKMDHEDDLDETSLDASVAVRFYAYRRFLADTRATVERCEIPVEHARLGYCGTADLVAQINGARLLIDTKNGGPSDWHGVQLAAYKEAMVEQAPLGAGHTALRRANLYLRGDGTYKIVERLNRSDWDCFRAALTLVNWRRACQKS